MKIKLTIYQVIFIGLILSLFFNCKKESVKVIPTVTVSAVTNITATSATCGGEITSDGGEMPVRGVCWSISQNPTIVDSRTSNGAGTGSFSSSITGLTPGTIYNIRAYGTNSVGSGYSSQSTFTTLALAPVLTTTDITAVTSTSASSGGNITYDGGATVTARGVCWSTSTTDPTITNSKTTDGTGTGTFTSAITGLSPVTTYYVRSYATNSIGTAYGSRVTTTTTDAITTTNVTNITATKAKSGGISTANGTYRGVCWSTSINPTTANSKTSDGIASGIITSTMTELQPGTTYYVRAYVTINSGTVYGNEVSFKTSTTISIGDSYLGGKLAYILQSGDIGFVPGETHGLIVAPSDQSEYMRWYNDYYRATGATATAIGTGNANTNTIVTNQGTGTYAAQLCHDLVLGGYSDWFLPSKDELNKLYLNNAEIGIIGLWGIYPYSPYYWSSSEYDASDAWSQNFENGIQIHAGKNSWYHVRAIRTF
jgi:hypothetical protein